jgi:Domain of unknown function (DUF397)
MNEPDGIDATPLTGPWRKSTYTNQGNCFELAPTDSGIALRNSNNHRQGTLYFTHAELTAFLSGCKAGEFDDMQ